MAEQICSDSGSNSRLAGERFTFIERREEGLGTLREWSNEMIARCEKKDLGFEILARE